MVSGAALAAATTSARVLYLLLMLVAMITGDQATCATGVKSFTGFHGRLLYSQGPTTRLSFWPITMS